MQPKPKKRVVTYVQRFILVFVVAFVCYFGYSVYVFGVRVRHIQAGLNISAANMYLDQYLQDNKGIIPPSFSNSSQLQSTLKPYGLTSTKSFYDSSVTILFNPHLAGQNVNKIASPRTLVSFYESKPDMEGYRWVGFLSTPGKTPNIDPPNAAVRWMKEKAWQAVRVKNNLP